MKKIAVALTLCGLLALTLLQSPTPAHALTSPFVVTSTADNEDVDNLCTLREAIDSSNGSVTDCDTAGDHSGIRFAVDGTITLGSTLPAINVDLVINGTGHTVAISGNNSVDILVVNSGKTVYLQDLTFALGGIALSNSGGTVHVVHSTFSNNGTRAIDNASGTLTVDTSSFSNNGGIYGGAIRNTGSLQITASTFTNNGLDNHTEQGGAIWSSGSLDISNSTFDGNRAQGSAPRHGGALYIGGGTATISATSFTNNQSVFGGAIYLGGGTLNVYGSTFALNSGGEGGALRLGGGTANIANSTIANNTAGYGGGINTGAALYVTNSTLYRNTSSASTGDNIEASGGTATLRNTLVSSNSTAPSCASFTGGSIVDGGHNLSYPDSTCPGIHQNPRLAPKGLQNNGTAVSGGTPTKTIALKPGSPAIDAGDNTICQLAPINNLDQRGGQRSQDGNLDHTATCDIGAFEHGGLKPGKPRLRAPTDLGKGQEQLRWRWTRDAFRYVVVVKDNAGNVVARKGTKNMSIAVTLGSGTFSWFVKACNALGCTKSASQSFTR